MGGGGVQIRGRVTYLSEGGTKLRVGGTNPREGVGYNSAVTPYCVCCFSAL